jgi:solute carrier family 25 carnitine/acylcarnitine transporter 20/29
MGQKALEDIAAGSFAGACSCLAGHAFDTVKVNMMSTHQGMLHTTKEILLKHGPKGLFRGIYYPLVTMPAINAVLFCVYEGVRALHTFESHFWEGMACGAVAGMAASFLVAPVDVVKCRMQMVGGGHRSSYACLLMTYRQEGFLRGVMRGVGITMAREVPGYSATFAFYEGTKARLCGGREPTTLDKVLAGVASGLGCTLFSHPQDVVKTWIQTNRGPAPAWKVAAMLKRKHGWRAFVKGVEPQLVREPLISIILFIAYEWFQKHALHRP